MRGAGLPIEVLIEYLDLFQQGDATIEIRKELLIKQLCTHEGSGLGYSERDIAKIYPAVTVLDKITIHGSSVSSTKENDTNWLSKAKKNEK